MKNTASLNSIIRSGEIIEIFDGVVFLESENYHSKQDDDGSKIIAQLSSLFPVFIVEPKSFSEILHTTVQKTNIHDVYNISIPISLTVENVQSFLQQLKNACIKRPLIWIEDAKNHQEIIKALSNNFIVYNITQNFCESKSMLGEQSQFSLEQQILHTLKNTDLMIARSLSISKEIEDSTSYIGSSMVMKNGVDVQYFLENFKNNNTTPLAKRAIFYGTIDQNINFELLHQLLHLLPDWEFVFCGAVSGNNVGWEILKTHSNVVYRGMLSPDLLVSQLCTATVGFMPYLYSDWLFESTPLHIEDYLAADLQLISTPIKGLEDFSNIHIAKDAKTFAEKMLKAAKIPRSSDPLAIVKEFSNEKIFSDTVKNIFQVYHNLINYPKKLNIIVLYCDRSTFIETVREYIESFQKFSNHNITFLPATYYYWTSEKFSAYEKPFEESIDFSVFDAVIVHYSVRLSLPNCFQKEIANKVAEFDGIKILFIQDEYENTETARKWMDKLRFNFVYTVVPTEFIEKVYPQSRFPETTFSSVLTGYVPENPILDHFITPMEKRTIHIAFRGRSLPFIYGELGQDKYRIGVDVKKLALEKNIPIDIEVNDSKRIYGLDWYRFVGSARATLGTESGANIFDFDGTIQKKIEVELKKNPSISFEKIFNKILKAYDGQIKMNQISPRVFEAIRLRTALILFEGGYSDVIKPDIHYIPLKKDYSNINEVFNKLNDLSYLKKLTNRAYKDIVESEKYTYKKFVEKVMHDIESRILKGPKYFIYSTPTFAQCARTKDLRIISINNPLSPSLSTDIINNAFLKREQIIMLNETQSYSNFSEPSFVSLEKKKPTDLTESISTPSLNNIQLSWIHSGLFFLMNIILKFPSSVQKRIISFVGFIKKIFQQFFHPDDKAYTKLKLLYRLSADFINSHAMKSCTSHNSLISYKSNRFERVYSSNAVQRTLIKLFGIIRYKFYKKIKNKK